MPEVIFSRNCKCRADGQIYATPDPRTGVLRSVIATSPEDAEAAVRERDQRRCKDAEGLL